MASTSNVLGYKTVRETATGYAVVGTAHAVPEKGSLVAACGRTVGVRVVDAVWPTKARYNPTKMQNLCRNCRRETGLPHAVQAN